MSEEESKFFDYGEVKLLKRQYNARQAILNIAMPCYLFQTVSPHLLQNGHIDDPKIKEPLAVWMPKISKDSINDVVMKFDSSMENRMNSYIKEHLEVHMKTFISLSQALKDPSCIIPFLPLGIYIEFRYRCNVDQIISVLEGIQSISVTGVHEFQWALASVLNIVLTEFQNFESIMKSTGRLPK